MRYKTIIFICIILAGCGTFPRVDKNIDITLRLDQLKVRIVGSQEKFTFYKLNPRAKAWAYGKKNIEVIGYWLDGKLIIDSQTALGEEVWHLLDKKYPDMLIQKHELFNN